MSKNMFTWFMIDPFWDNCCEKTQRIPQHNVTTPPFLAKRQQQQRPETLLGSPLTEQNQ